MLFKIDNNSLSAFTSNWIPKELEIEKYIISSADSEVPTLDPSIFGEPLLLIKNQVITTNKKRADILAIDRLGNGVIIELKRDEGYLGVENQALQYLADFSKSKGHFFLKRFSKINDELEQKVLSFIGGNTTIENLNKNSRIILLARKFDPTLFSMGEWLSNHNVAFRCIEYSPVEIENKRFISFSIAFDRSPEFLFPIMFNSITREPQYFWHNIASADNKWWRFLVDKKQIPACFKNAPGDQGEKLLTGYISGDTIIAYAKGFGAVGWGIIENPTSYRLLKVGDSDDKLKGNCLHRIEIFWKATASQLSEGIKPETVRDKYGIYHPISTSVTIDENKAKKLIESLNQKFNN